MCARRRVFYVSSGEPLTGGAAVDRLQVTIQVGRLLVSVSAEDSRVSVLPGPTVNNIARHASVTASSHRAWTSQQHQTSRCSCSTFLFKLCFSPKPRQCFVRSCVDCELCTHSVSHPVERATKTFVQSLLNYCSKAHGPLVCPCDCTD